MVEESDSQICAEFTSLTNKSSPSAFYNTGDNPKCHSQTRIAILDQLKEWIVGNIEPRASILWLNGEAGTGKSCIARSIAEWCDQQQLLLASFFFLRTDSTRNNTQRFISSLAYTISQTVPESRPSIEQAIRRDPHIFDKAIDIQMNRLIIDPLLVSKASTQPVTIPCVFVIDGLDECIHPSQQKDIIRLFAACITKNLRWKFLITSRRDQAIRTALDRFVPRLPTGLSTRIEPCSEYNTNADIRRVLEEIFAEIRTIFSWRHPIPIDWPSSDDIDKLVSKSSGQFIYAATVVKHVSSSDYDNPVDRLRSILDDDIDSRHGVCNFPEVSVAGDIDSALYAHILQTSRNLEFWLQRK